MADVTLTAAVVEITAPALTISGGTFLVYTTADFTVAAPPLGVVLGKPGQSLDELSLAPPNVLARTTTEVWVLAANGLPSVPVSARTMDLTRRRYEVSTPVTQYAPNGKLPIVQDTGVYVSGDSGATWQALMLPDFRARDYFGLPLFDVRDGTTYLWYAPRGGQLARYDTTTQKTILSQFVGVDIATVVPVHRAVDLSIFPSTGVLLLAGFGTGFWRSTDGGLSFLRANTGIVGDITTSAVACHPTEPGLVYAATFGNTVEPARLYTSMDSGSTWVELTGYDAATYGGVATIALGTEADVLYLFCTDAILKSSDAGATFAEIHTGLPVSFRLPSSTGLLNDGPSLVVAPSDPAILYAVLEDAAAVLTTSLIVRSDDAGATWATVRTIEQSIGNNQYLPTRGLAVHPLDSDLVSYVSIGAYGTAGVEVSDDGGTTWTLKNESAGFPSTEMLQGVAYDAGTRMAATGYHKPTDAAGEIVTGSVTTYEELQEMSVTLPLAPGTVEAIEARVDHSVDPPRLPVIHVTAVDHYRNGVRVYRQLARIRLERLDVRKGNTDRSLTLYGSDRHPDIARGPQPVRAIPQSAIEGVEEGTQELSITMPGIHTEFHTYDQIEFDGRTARVSAIRHAITTERRTTILGTGATNTATVVPTATAPLAYPRVTIGRTPSTVRRGRATGQG